MWRLTKYQNIIHYEQPIEKKMVDGISSLFQVKKSKKGSRLSCTACAELAVFRASI
jgi:hypothetical protein